MAPSPMLLQLRRVLTPANTQAAVLWGGCAATGALFLVQPFDFIKGLVTGAPAEGEEK